MGHARHTTTLAAGLRLFARGYWRGFVLLALTSILAAIITAGAIVLLSDLAWAQRDTLFVDGSVTETGLVRLVLLVGLPAGILIAVLALIGIAAVAVVHGDVRLNRGASVPAAAAIGAQRLPALAGALLIAVLEIVLAIALAPVISLVALGTLLVRGVLHGVRRVRARRERPVQDRRADAARRPSWRMLALFAIPFGLAATIWVNSLLILPVAVHEKRGPIGVLKRSSELVQGRVWRVTGVALMGVAVYVLVQYGIELLRGTGIDGGVVGWLFALSQPLLAALPVAMLVAAYFAALGSTPPSPAVLRPTFARRPIMAATATAATTALVIGLMVGIPSGQAWAAADPTDAPDPTTTVQPFAEGEGAESPAPSETAPDDPMTSETPPGEGEGEEGGGSGKAAARVRAGRGGGEGGSGGPRNDPLSFAVDSLGDETDALPGDGRCATAAGTCTVRAAIAENNAWKAAGVSAIIPATAEIASGTVVLTSPLLVTYPLSFYSTFDFPDASGMTLDGRHTTQLVRFDAAWGQASQWYDLTLMRGYAGAGAQGGAVEVTRGRVIFERTVFLNNHALSGAQAVSGPNVDHSISTYQAQFVDNGVPACTPDGFSASSTTIDVEDDSCPGTTSLAASVRTTVSVAADPVTPRRGSAVSYTALVTPAQQTVEPLGGSVTFQIEGQEPIEVPVPADGRVQTPVTTAPGEASYSVRVSYSGSTGYRASLGEATVTTAGSTSALELTATSGDGGGWYRGHPLALTAIVTSGTPGTVPTGTVTFSAGGVELGEAAVGADGRASFDTTITTENGDAHSGAFRWGVLASYSGDAEHPAADAVKDLYLNSDRTRVTITPSVPDAAPGDSVTFTAKVTSLEPGAGPVTAGAVTFSSPSGLHAPILVDARGEASITVAGIGFGTHGISASYGSAPARYVPSTGRIDYSVTGTVDSVTTITRLSDAVSAPGDEVAFLIGVSTDPGVPAGVPGPTGSVRLFLGGSLLHETTLGDNTTVRTDRLPLGTSTVRVEYLGDRYHRASSASLTQTVAKAPTRTWLSTSAPSSVIGEPIELTVSTETATLGQISQPLTAGTVEIYAGATLIAQVDLAAGGTATAVLPDAPGPQTLRAVFLGDDRHASSQSAGHPHHQSPALSTVELTVAETALPYSGIIDAAVSVTGVAPSLSTPVSGNVRLLAGDAEIARSALGADGTVRFRLDTGVLLPGTHALRAAFGDNSWFAAGTSDAVTVTIAQHTPAVSLTASGAGETLWGEAVHLTARVDIPWTPLTPNIDPADASPLGTIEYSVVTGDVTTPLGTRPVTEQYRAATFEIDPAALPVGTHEFHAQFTPSTQTMARLTRAAAAGVAHVVLPVPVTVTIGGLDGLLPGEAFIRSVIVRESAADTTGILPTGTVTILLDGAPLTTVTLTAVPQALASIADVALPALGAGDHRIDAHYSPASTSPHRAQSQSFPFTMGRITPIVTLTAAEPAVEWDEYLWVRASADKRFPGDPDPRGTIVVSDGVNGGAQCEIRVAPGILQPQTECPLFWPTAGPRTLQAHFEPAEADPVYSAGISSPLDIAVTRRTVQLVGGIAHSGVVGGAPVAPTAGDTLTARWSASGVETGDRAPTGAVAVTLAPATAGTWDGCGTDVTSGSCAFPLSIAASLLNQVTVTVSYPGDERYAAATWTGAVQPRACVTLELEASPRGAGVISPDSPPNCGEPGAPKSGFAVGTQLGFTAAALPSGAAAYAWAAPDRVSTATGDGILTVSRTANWASATFTKSYNCTMVTIERRTLRGTTGDVVLPGQAGSTDPAPNCPAAMAGGSLPPFSGWSTTSVIDGTASLRVHTAAYLRGTELSFALTPGRSDTKVYAFASPSGWQRDGAWGIARQAVGTGTDRISVTFGPTCYAATAAATGRGDVSILNARNCSDPTTGTSGWYADTVLDVYATPRGDTTSYPFVRTWSGTDRLDGTAETRGVSETGLLDTVLLRHARSEQLRAGRTTADQVDSVVVRAGAASPRILVEFGECHALSAGFGSVPSTWQSVSDAARMSLPGDCPNPFASAAFYDERTEVSIEATPPLVRDGRYPNNAPAQTYFSGWQMDAPDTTVAASTGLIAENPVTVRMDRDRSVRANFHFSYDCAQVFVRADAPQYVSVAGSLPGVAPYCERGTLETSGETLYGTLPRQVQRDTSAPVGELVLAAQPAEGLNPMLGWTFTSTVRDYSGKIQLGSGHWTETTDTRRTYTNSIAGSTVRIPLTMEYLNAKAVACQQIDASVDMVTEDGRTLHDFDNDDQLILVYPAPNCPYVQNAYLVGTEVELWALGNPLGYGFTGWSGDQVTAEAGEAATSQLATELGEDSAFLDEDFPPGVLRTVTMDGTSPTLSVVAHYDAICHEVTIEGNAGDVTWYPAPNCPGAEGEVVTTEYSDKALLSRYGGTQMGQARDFKKMRELRGPRTMSGRYVGGTEVLIQARGQSNMVWTGWRGDAVQEGRVNPGSISVDGDKLVHNTYRGKSTAEQFEDFGEDVAIFAKKAVGFTAVVFTEYLKYYPPLGAVTGIAEGMSLVGTILEMAGVSAKDVQYLHYAKQMIDLPFSLLSCAGTWGLGGSTGLVTAAATNTASVLKQGTYRVTNITDAAMDEAKHVMKMNAGSTGLYMSAKLQYYSGKLALAELAPKIAPAVGIGVAVYGAIQGSGVTWDSSASSAWTDGSGYTECLRKAVPQFMYDALGESGQGAIGDFTAKVANGMQSGAIWATTGNLPGEGGTP